MGFNDLKKQLHSYIDMIDDETQLQMLNEAAETYATQKFDILDALSPEQLKRLEASIKQADDENFTPHEEVMKRTKQWLTK